MTGNAFLSQLGNITAYRSKFASDPIELTHHLQDHATSKDNSMRLFWHQNSISLSEKTNEGAAKSSSLSASRFKRESTSDACDGHPGDHAEEHPEIVVCLDSRDDNSVIDEDLILPHLLGREGSHDNREDEAIEIVNISYLHE